jgi:hypothetical protein
VNEQLSPWAARVLATLAVIWLCGCAGPTFRNDVRSYSQAYAQASDEQMLYNLARLNNGLPPYFLTIGQINSNYDFGASNEGTVGATNQSALGSSNGRNFYAPGATGALTAFTKAFSNLVTHTANFGDNLTTSAQSTPYFTYIPLNGDSAAKQFLTQVPPEVFEHFCQQGWPIDQLLRVLVDRIEIRLPNGQLAVMTNSPTRGDPQSYVLFLRICGELRYLQREGKLVIRNKKGITYFGGGGQFFPNPNPKDLISADSAGYNWYKIGDNAWMIGKETDHATFTLLPNAKTESESAIGGSVSQINLLTLLKNGITLDPSIPSADDTSSGGGAYLVLRSFSTALSSVATEENSFYEILKRFPPTDPHGIPMDECRPILELMWKESEDHDLPEPAQWKKLTPAYLSMNFAGKTYSITDPIMAPGSDDSLTHWSDKLALATWNRDIFRLIVELQSEIGVDLSKYQNQVIQFRQQ